MNQLAAAHLYYHVTGPLHLPDTDFEFLVIGWSYGVKHLSRPTQRHGWRESFLPKLLHVDVIDINIVRHAQLRFLIRPERGQ